jgi:adenylosuccinate lyase
MIARYQREIMKELWSETNKFDAYLKVELACSYAWLKQGLFDESTYEALEKASFNLDDIYRIEQETKHDVIAFTKAVSLTLGEEKKWLHYGLTSTDVVDTAQSLILKKVNRILIEDMQKMMAVLKEKALLYKDLPIMGRTHGIHAEVTSFGLKYALWYEDFKRLFNLFIEAAKNVEVAKVSGAVGNYSANGPMIETIAAKKLGLETSNISTQTLQRDRHANYISVIALIGAELEKIAVEIRHLSRTEVKEVSEYFSIDQKGSSAMPHKKNPISSENISGLSRVLKGYMVTAYDNIALWHERDISHSSAERIIIADATTLLDYMLNRYTHTLDQLVIHESQMMRNIDLTQGVVFAQSVLHQLIDQGLVREAAYNIVQSLAHKALNERTSFKELLLGDKDINEYLDKEQIEACFDIKKHLKYIPDIYQKVFGVDISL